MTDSRGSKGRRAAEREALQVLSGKVAFIGDLGTAAAACAAAAESVQAARVRAAELVAAAQLQGEQLVSSAVADVGEADGAYAAAFQRAVDEGWSRSMLVSLGYTAPVTVRRPRGSATAAGRGGVRPDGLVSASEGVGQGDAALESAA